MNYLALGLLLAAGFCVASVTRSNTYGDFYDSLGDEIKHPFLRYQLALAVVEETTLAKAKFGPTTDDLLTAEGLGVPDSVFSNLQELNTPPGFSNRLYTLVTKSLGLSYSQVISLIKTSQSCQGPGCWDLGDVGSNCC